MALLKGLCSSTHVVVQLVLLVLVARSIRPTDGAVGVCYGMNGNNLPSEQDTVNLYKSNGISYMRLYGPDSAALESLKGSGIGLILDVPNSDLQSLAFDATQWIQSNVVPYASSVEFRYISVGNEVMPGDPAAQYVLPAMNKVQNALSAANLAGNIKVSTAVKSSILTNTFPPSNSAFTSSDQYTGPIVNFLKENGSPLLANIYPYFSYTGDTQGITLAYALFTSPGTVVTDSANGLQYQNLFDALVDSLYAALEKAGAPDLNIVVSESGWPSDGGNAAATVDNAGTYYKNLIAHVQSNTGTPKKAGNPIETYLFAMYDENQKSGDATEQHFGLFDPNTRQPKYQLSFA